MNLKKKRNKNNNIEFLEGEINTHTHTHTHIQFKKDKKGEHSQPESTCQTCDLSYKIEIIL
jgi:hypothetical protein